MLTVEWTEPRRVTPLWLSPLFLFSLVKCQQINSKIPIEKKKKKLSLDPDGIHTWLMHLLSIQSVQISCSAMSDSLRPYGWHHTRHLGPSPIPGACSDSRPVSCWCYSTISSSFPAAQNDDCSKKCLFPKLEILLLKVHIHTQALSHTTKHHMKYCTGIHISEASIDSLSR